MTEQECVIGKALYENITLKGTNVISVASYIKFVDMAIKALEKQIPKKVAEVDITEEDDFYYLSFMCPSCCMAVIGQPYRPKNCKHCGQKLDWSDEDE